MADPRKPGEASVFGTAADASHGDETRLTAADRDLGLGYGGSEEGNRAGPLYDPGPEPGLGYGGSDERGRSAAVVEPTGAVRGAEGHEGLMREASGAPTDLIRATKVKGTDVYNHDGEHLGHIDDVVLSKREGHVVYAIMSFGGFLGLGEQYHPLPWDKLDYDPDRGGYVVNVSRAQLEGAPSYRPGEEPNWNDAGYGGELTRYYVPPLL